MPWSADDKIVGLYRARSRDELDGLLGALPLFGWMDIAVTALDAHPNDPAAAVMNEAGPGTGGLPAPRLRFVYRLEAGLGEPLDAGDVPGGHRRIVPQTGGTFTGPELNGTLLAGASADWQLVLADATALGDIRYTLQTADSDLLYVQSSGVYRLARGGVAPDSASSALDGSRQRRPGQGSPGGSPVDRSSGGR
jgi:hypothetical protein